MSEKEKKSKNLEESKPKSKKSTQTIQEPSGEPVKNNNNVFSEPDVPKSNKDLEAPKETDEGETQSSEPVYEFERKIVIEDEKKHYLRVIQTQKNSIKELRKKYFELDRKYQSLKEEQNKK